MKVRAGTTHTYCICIESYCPARLPSIESTQPVYETNVSHPLTPKILPPPPPGRVVVWNVEFPDPWECDNNNIFQDFRTPSMHHQLIPSILAINKYVYIYTFRISQTLNRGIWQNHGNVLCFLLKSSSLVDSYWLLYIPDKIDKTADLKVLNLLFIDKAADFFLPQAIIL